MTAKNADLDVLETCVTWLRTGHRVDLVTVAKTWGSSPKPPGSLAAIRDDGVLVGSVSGGCVEKQLAEAFQGKVLSRVHSHRIDDQQARRYGLACGGELELVFETLDDPAPLESIIAHLQKRQRIKRLVTIGSASAIVCEANERDTFAYDGEELQKVFGPVWQLLLIGAGQLSAFVAEFAFACDFDILVCEPRTEFRQAWRFNDALLIDKEPHDAVIEHANDINTAVLALTHDPNLDDAALIEALPQPCFYVGALGSKKNYERRCQRLLSVIEKNHIDRLSGPIGMPIGSRTSAEIAISIVAEIIKVRAQLTKSRSVSA